MEPMSMSLRVVEIPAAGALVVTTLLYLPSEGWLVRIDGETAGNPWTVFPDDTYARAFAARMGLVTAWGSD